MQALAERIEAWLGGATFEGFEPLGFSGLKTYEPPPDALIGTRLERADRRAKYVSLWFDGGLRIVFHLSRAGRVDFEEPAKRTKPKGAVARWRFSGGRAVLLREFGTERKAGWWVLPPGEEGPLAGLGPEATSDEFARWLRDSGDGRRIHTIPRPADGRGRRPRIRRRRAASRAAVAVRVAEVAEVRRARAAGRGAAGGAGRGFGA
jgi:formamidopyrimidine-DNA glycosylase